MGQSDVVNKAEAAVCVVETHRKIRETLERRLGGRQGEIGSRIPLDEAPLAFRELLIVGSSLQGLGRCGPYGCQEYLRAKFLI